MSFVPNKAVPHAKPEAGQFDAESGKIVSIATAKPVAEAPARRNLGWIVGAAGAGLAAAALATLLTLRSSGRATPERRRSTRTAKAAKPQRRRGAERKRAA